MMSKRELYESLAAQLRALVQGEPDLIANLANASALLNSALPDINWVGFYLLKQEDELVLGPFQGKPACLRIPVGKGVCGTAVSTGRVQRVADVHQFAGHIACDSASNSEIVLPLWVGKKVVAVLDIDSPNFDRFDAEDQTGLELIVNELKNLNWVG
ncbi:MAG: GAF domain-containing protein [Aeromonadaceae bacterium]